MEVWKEKALSKDFCQLFSCEQLSYFPAVKAVSDHGGEIYFLTCSHILCTHWVRLQPVDCAIVASWIYLDGRGEPGTVARPLNSCCSSEGRISLTLPYIWPPSSPLSSSPKRLWGGPLRPGNEQPRLSLTTGKLLFPDPSSSSQSLS